LTRFGRHAHFITDHDQLPAWQGWMMMFRRMILGGGVCVVAILALSMSAEAKRARCFTSDDGYFPCSYRSIDGAGSFRISAPGYPTYVLEIDGPGFAYGYVNLGRRNVPLPGQFVRSRDDGACWNNPQTNTKLCAW
jgi:hypothetical protein